MSDGIAAYGTILAIEGSAIAEVNSLSGPGLSLDPIEITHHESPDAWKEFVGGLLDAGEIPLDVNFIPTATTHTANASGSLLYTMISRAAAAFTLTWPDSTAWSFDALVTAFEPSAPVDDKLGASVTLKLTGAPSDILSGGLRS